MNYEDKFKKIKRDNNMYLAEKIFTGRRPRSRVLAELIKEIKERIDFSNNLIHKNYINYTGLDQFDGEFYLLSRENELYLPLLRYLNINRPSLEEIVDWMIELAGVASLAASKGILWPKLTLGSLQIDAKGELKVIDPEIAVLTAPYLEQTDGKLFAVEYYQPPEMLNGQVYHDQRSLLYMTGVIFYYLVTGQHPFAADSITASYDRKKKGIIIKPRLLNEEISSSLNDLIMKLLATREERYNNWDELINCLNRLRNKDKIRSNEVERNSNKEEAGKVLNNVRRMEKIRSVVKGKGKLAALILLSILFLALISVFDSSPTIITKETPPLQVVKYIYRGIDEKNLDYLKETTVLELSNLENLISRTYVMEKVSNAYQIPQSPEQKNSSSRKLFGINNLQIEVLNSSTERHHYKAEYVFYINQEEEQKEIEMTDYLWLEKIDEKWQIIRLEGDLSNIIQGQVNKFIREETKTTTFKTEVGLVIA